MASLGEEQFHDLIEYLNRSKYFEERHRRAERENWRDRLWTRIGFWLALRFLGDKAPKFDELLPPELSKGLKLAEAKKKIAAAAAKKRGHT